MPSAEDTRKSNKFVLPMELAEYYGAGSSVIYYQHKARRPDDFYVMQHRNLMGCGAFPGAKGLGLKFKTTSQRYYFFLMQPHHADRTMNCVREMMEREWKRHFEVVG